MLFLLPVKEINKLTWGGVWIKLAGCVALRSVAICITEWTEAGVRWWSWIAALLLGGESDSWKKMITLFRQGLCEPMKNWIHV